MRIVKALPKPSPIYEESKQLFSRALPQGKKPVAPITTISGSLMGMKDNIVSIRNLFLIPWIAGMFVVLYLQGEEIYTDWKAEELAIVRHLDAATKLHGADYLLSTNNQTIADYLSVIDQGELSFSTYIKKIRYSEKFYAYPEKILRSDIFHTSVATSLILLLGTISIRMKRHAPIHFDRDKNLVYTWRSGKVWAQRYKNLAYFYNPQAMYFYLRFLDPKDESKPLWLVQFQIQPSGNPIWNTWDQQQNVLSAIVKFMEQGRDAVWPTDWRGRKNFYFFEDKKPEDFDRQLALILQKIDEEKAVDASSHEAQSNRVTA